MNAESILLLSLCLATGVPASYYRNDKDLCAFKELPCDNKQCIPRDAWCDGPTDCTDGSDEQYCTTGQPGGPVIPNRCNDSLHFTCDSGKCIPKAGLCDDMPDCGDTGEDENNCDYDYATDAQAAENANESTSTSSTTTTSTTTTTTTTTTTPAPIPTPGKQLTWLPSPGEVFRKSLHHVVQTRDPMWGWGRATPRVVTALSLANGSYFDLDNHDGLMSRKQLEVQLALDLMRQQERPLRFQDLVHYVHALVATCLDPRDFHGVNVIRLLKKSMAQRQSKGLFVNPVAYLALCNAGEFSDAYLRKLKNMAYRRSEEQRWLDIQAYALLAISCRTLSKPSDAREWLPLRKDVALNITEWQQPDGSFGSVHSTGLALQALIAAEEPGTESSKGRAMTYLLTKQDWQGSFGHEVDNYYVLPALNRKSLAHLHARNCKPDLDGTQNTESAVQHQPAPGRRQMLVHYSLWIGGDRNEIHTLTLGLPRHSSFVDVMEAAEKANPRYRHETLTTARGMTVHSIAGRPSNVEKSTYWTLYRKVPLPFKPLLSNITATVARLKLFGAKRWIKDLRKLHPKEGEHLAFWYKPYL